MSSLSTIVIPPVILALVVTAAPAATVAVGVAAAPVAEGPGALLLSLALPGLLFIRGDIILIRGGKVDKFQKSVRTVSTHVLVQFAESLEGNLLHTCSSYSLGRES